MSLKVVVAVGPLLQREGLCAMLEQFDEFEIVPADDAAVDVVLLEAGGSLTGTSAASGVIVVGEEPDAEAAQRLFESGVAGRGYLLYGELRSGDLLAFAIRSVAAGASAISPEVAIQLGKNRRTDDESPIAELTSRQTAVLAEVATGKSNAAIAALLGITKRAVERHLGAIYARLGLQDDKGASPRVAASLLYLGALRGR